MATLPIKPLDGADGYQRWKESVLLRLHSVGVAHVLSDDAVCGGHILYALSDRIFPDYVRHGTGRAVWQAVARTYDLDKPFDSYSRQYEIFLHRFRFEEKEGGGASASFLEQLAHAEALVATRDPPPDDYAMALLADMATPIRCGEMSMDRIWKYALDREMDRIVMEDQMERLSRQAEAACVGQESDRNVTGHRHRRR